MVAVLRFVLTLLTAVATTTLSGCHALESEDTDDGLARIIDGCEWISRQNVISEILLDRYRKYAMDNFFLLDDVCAVYEWNKNLRAPELNEKNDEELNQFPQNNPDKPADDLRSALAAFNRPSNASCAKSAKDCYLSLSSQLGDPVLNTMILDNLEIACDPRYSSPAVPLKRNSKYVSKQKFYSWGGKRNNPQIFYPWGGKRNTGRVHRQPKVVIRNPFHAWGGKRNQQGEPEM